jgi:citrate synthase
MTAPFNHLQDELIKNNSVNPELYKNFEVKRGLRNRDGSGVLAGLSHISSVVGFTTLEGEINPVEGILRYRGISIQDLISTFDTSSRYCFETVVFLLLVGRLPSEDEKKDLIDYMVENRDLPEEILEHIIKPIPSKHIMNKLQTAVSALYAFDEDPDNLDPLDNFYKTLRLISQMGTIVAYSYLNAYKENPTFVKAPADMSHAEAFLYMLNEGEAATEIVAHIMDIALILHAEHGGGNNSTFTTYVVTSSGSDIYSTMAAAIASLKGPLHGSANQKVMEMMGDIKDNVSDWENKDEIAAYLTKIVNKEAHDKSGKIFGLGHAVYTKSDPRALIIHELAKDLAKEKGREKEMSLYSIISADGPGIFQTIKGSTKVISPNVDFYSGFVYDCMGIPEQIYTPMFAMARASGWAAHRIEEGLSGKRIIRPGYKFIKP